MMRCGASLPFDPSDPLPRCVKASGHSGLHLLGDGTEWSDEEARRDEEEMVTRMLRVVIEGTDQTIEEARAEYEAWRKSGIMVGGEVLSAEREDGALD